MHTDTIRVSGKLRRVKDGHERVTDRRWTAPHDSRTTTLPESEAPKLQAAHHGPAPCVPTRLLNGQQKLRREMRKKIGTPLDRETTVLIYLRVFRWDAPETRRNATRKNLKNHT
ncbi:hypothetical protein JCM12178A_18690 [Salidesulfovibrio brasiliensis]